MHHRRIAGKQPGWIQTHRSIQTTLRRLLAAHCMFVERNARETVSQGATGTVRKRMRVVALAVPSQLGAASPSAGDSRRYNGGSVQMHPASDWPAFGQQREGRDEE